jgi:glutamate--cysteine ligase
MFGNDDVASSELVSEGDLEEYFDDGCKQRSAWKIGVEYEMPVVSAQTGDAVHYDGAAGIGAILERMRTRPQREGVYEDGNLIAVRAGRASITLEPGGQLEMSGEQFDSLHGADAELSAHIAEIVTIGRELGLFFLGLGIAPTTALADMPWMPKERYRIMRAAMETSGRLGHRMMQQTATVQSNFDYASETDAQVKFRVAMAVAPVLVAMAANSPIVDGQDTGYKSYRAHIWQDTDPARCGILPFAFDTENLFGAYTQYALDVPMYFLYRDGRHLPSEGRTFRQFLSHGIEGHRATYEDWTMHLTSLFPEARLKTYIEIRAADMQAANLVLAIPALMKGLLYEDDCLDAAWDVLRGWSLEQRLEAGEGAARDGLQARVGRHTMQSFAHELIAIAHEGLRRQALLDADGQDETRYLEVLANDVEAGLTPADRILSQWNGAWGANLERLVRYAACKS